MGNRRPGSDTALRAVQPVRAAAMPEQTVGHRVIGLVLEESRLVHITAGADAGVRVCSPQLATLRALAEQRGASAVERQRCAATNIARNYYDGGRDIEVALTLTLTFSSAVEAARFLAAARPSLLGWRVRRRAHAATLRLDGADFALGAERDLQVALGLLARSTDARPIAPQPHGAPQPR